MSHKAKRAKTEAHLVAPEEARAAASAVGPACTILELVERFEQSKYFDGKGTVDANKLVNGFNLHLEESGLRPQGGEEMPLGHGIVNVEHRPPMESVFHLVSFPEAGRAKVVAVPTKSLSDELEKKGWIPANFDYHSSRPLPALPPYDGKVVVRGVCEATSAAEKVTVPCKLPAIEQKKGAPSHAQQIVVWFETKVEVDGVEYSPMRLWSKKARKDQLLSNQRGSFRERCEIYRHVRCTRGNELPTNINEGYNELREAALNEVKGKKNKGDKDAWEKAREVSDALGH